MPKTRSDEPRRALVTDARGSGGRRGDAVYFGLRHFSARPKVGFTLEEIAGSDEIIARARGSGISDFQYAGHVFEHELGEAARAIAAAAQAGVDALDCAVDVGILRLVLGCIAPCSGIARQHADEYYGCAAGVEFARDLGVDRVTLAR